MSRMTVWSKPALPLSSEYAQMTSHCSVCSSTILNFRSPFWTCCAALVSSEIGISSKPVSSCVVLVTSLRTMRLAGEWCTTAMQSVPWAGLSQVDTKKLVYLHLAAKSV